MGIIIVEYYNPVSLYLQWALLTEVSEMQTLLPGPNEADKRQFIVSGLIPYNNYRFRVYASNAYLDPGELSRPTGKIVHTCTLSHLNSNIVYNLLQII